MTKLTCRCLAAFVFASLFAGGVVADEASEVKPATSFISLYQNYDNARYAVQWYASAKEVAFAREKMARYSYLILYSADSLLSTTASSVVQFGFFKTSDEAAEFVSHNILAFPGASVVSVSPEEHDALFSMDETLSSDDGLGLYWLTPKKPGSETSMTILMEKAKAYYIQKNFSEALKYYAVLSLTSNVKIAKWSREVMAVCYERLGELSQAADTYRQLLVTYPDSKGSARLAQRLRAIETAADDEKLSLRSPSGKQEDKAYWRGVIGQSYNQWTRSDQYKNPLDPNESDSADPGAKTDVVNALISHYDLHAGVKFSGQKIDIRLNGYDFYDMRDYGDDSKTAIKRFYVNYSNDGGLSIVGGRQKDSYSGVYTSFDGAALRYALGDHWTLGASAGVPVYFSKFSSYIDRQFYSLNTSYDSNNHWSGSAYVTQQTIFDEVERSAFGGQLKYVSGAFNSFLNLDYDLAFKELNILRWSGTLLFSKKSQGTVTYGFQRNPFLTASNIQLGQPYRDIEAYIKRDDFNHDNLLSDALDRTSKFTYGLISYQYRIDEELQLVSNIYHAKSSGLPIFSTDDEWATSSVESYDEDYEYTSASIQAISYGLFGDRDTAVFSFKHNDSTYSSSNGFRFSESFRFGKKVYVKPKLGFRNVKRQDTDSGQNRLRTSIAFTYKPTRSAEIRAEIGSEMVEDLELKSSVDTTYFIFGYRARF